MSYTHRFRANKPTVIGSFVFKCENINDRVNVADIPTLIGHYVCSLRIPVIKYVPVPVPLYTTQPLAKDNTTAEYHLLLDRCAPREATEYSIRTYRKGGQPSVLFSDLQRDQTLRQYTDAVRDDAAHELFLMVARLALLPAFSGRVQRDVRNRFIILPDHETYTSGLGKMCLFNDVVFHGGWHRDGDNYFWTTEESAEPTPYHSAPHDGRVFVPYKRRSAEKWT